MRNGTTSKLRPHVIPFIDDNLKRSGFAPFKGHLGRISHIAFSPDGRRIATASGSELNVRIWSVADGSLETAFSFGKADWLKGVGGIAFSPDGETLYVVVEREILAWMPATHAIRWRRRVRGYPKLSPDGRTAVIRSGYRDEENLRFFDLETRRYRGDRHERWTPEAFSPDGRYLRAESSGLEPAELLVLDVATGKVVWQGEKPSNCLFLEGPEGLTLAAHYVSEEAPDYTAITRIALPDLKVRDEVIPRPAREILDDWSEATTTTTGGGRWLFRCTMHEPAVRIDMEQPRREIAIDAGVSYDVCLAASPDGRWIAIGDDAGSLRLIDAEDTRVVWRTPSGIPIRCATVSDDSLRLAVLQGRPRKPAPRSFLWDLERLALLGEMEAGENQVDRFEDWRFDRSLRWLGKADRWTPEGTPLGHKAGLDGDTMGCCTVVHASFTIVHSEDGEVIDRYYETFEGDQVPIPSSPWGDDWGDRIRTISRNGRWMGIAGGNEAYVIDVATRERVHSMPYPAVEQDAEEEDAEPPDLTIVGIAVAEDGMRLAVGFCFSPFDVLLFDFAQESVRKIPACCDTFDSLAFDPDGKLLAIGDAYQPFIAVADTVRQRRKRVLELHTSAIRSLDFTPDGRWLVSAAADGQVILWNATTFQPEAILMILSHPGDPVRWAVLTPDGQVKGSPGIEREFLGPRVPPLGQR